MGTIEAIVTSPYFAIFLVLVGLWLFILLAREFSVWFFKLNHFENDLKDIKIKLEEISQNISKNSKNVVSDEAQKVAPLNTSSLPPIPTTPLPPKEQFPFQH